MDQIISEVFENFFLEVAVGGLHNSGLATTLPDQPLRYYNELSTAEYWQANVAVGSLKILPTSKLSSSNVYSPKIGTPTGNVDKENCTGWTPYFAEEYSVFNSTPGRLTNCVTLTFNSPIQSQGISRREATSDLDISINPSVESQSLLGADIKYQHLTSCDSKIMKQGIFFSGNVTQCVTPKPVKRFANEIFTGQTATPPASASQTSRKLEFNYLKEKLHRDNHHIFTSPTAMRQSTKSFFFSESNLSHQDSFKKDVTTFGTDLSSSKDDIFFSSLHNTIDNHFDWSDNILTPRSDTATFGLAHEIPILYSGANEPQSFNNNLGDIRDSFSCRLIPHRLENFDEPSDCFLNASISGVNPELLVSRKSSISMSSSSIDTPISLASAANPSIEPLIPYEHQQRESIRSQEERSCRQSIPHRLKSLRSINYQEVCSHKFLANSRPLKKLRRNGEFNSKGKRSFSNAYIINFGSDSDLPNTKCLFPTQKHNLTKKKPFSGSSSACRRTELRLIVDSSGKARTETITTRTTGGKKRESYCAKMLRNNTQLDEKSSLSPALNRYITLSQHFSPTGISKAKIFQEKKSSNYKSLKNNRLIDDFSSSDTESNVLSHRNLGDATLELREVIKSRKKILTSANPHQDYKCFSEIL
ncbi:hypothetical protein EPUL_005738 [Erysiphe pulchra]|uniref:Uncharacterized protein n=1 Tax=Erysiphe pulchra TaxID=225359 RepID=A0A2S4PS66_9PEZI|nr:hypothetical protein EPUL_005738 [Erysiphe pulchra]